MSYMYMHSTHAHALHKRTSLRTPPRAAERSMAVVMAATAAARPPTVDLRPLAAMAASLTIAICLCSGFAGGALLASSEATTVLFLVGFDDA